MCWKCKIKRIISKLQLKWLIQDTRTVRGKETGYLKCNGCGGLRALNAKNAKVQYLDLEYRTTDMLAMYTGHLLQRRLRLLDASHFIESTMKGDGSNLEKTFYQMMDMHVLEVTTMTAKMIQNKYHK